MSRPLSLCKVLMVEDVEESRLMLRQVLSRLGVTVIEAHDGQEGVELARRERPDLVLMDISLPVMDGWQAIAALRADPATASLPIIVVTAHSSSEDTRRAKGLGCDGYVTKPLAVQAFSHLVADVLLGEFVSLDRRW